MLAGCGFPSPDATGSGELGNGHFGYHCEGPNDLVCTEGLSQGSFPACILLGSTFGLGFSAIDDQFRDAEVVSASSAFFGGSTFHFTANRVGRAALVAQSEGRVIDMIHFDIVEPSGIGVWRNGSAVASPVPVAVGSREALQVVVGGACGPVGGSLDVDAASSDPAVASVAFGELGLVVTGVSEGTARIDLVAGAVATSFEVIVEGADEPEPPRRTTPEVTGGDTEADSDTDTDGDTDTDTDGDTDTDAATDTDAQGSTGG